MSKTTSRYEIDMCNGPLLRNILRFAIPLALSGILQLTFNAADIIVLGRFAGNVALAAVGSTAELNHLIITLFVGLSTGVNVMVAKYRGAREDSYVEETVHTAIMTALIGGVFLIFAGGLLARPMLTLMGTPHDVIDHAVLYMRIYFIGMPGTMIYNFGSSVLRAVGDTKRPMYFLTFAGALNLVLNLIFVIVLQMGVAGVAIATALSQTVSAVLVMYCLIKNDGVYKVNLKSLRIVPHRLAEMARIGIPAGMQGALFGIANITIQSSINSFGSVAMSGCTVGGNIEGFTYIIVNSLHQACLSFIGQNYGAKNYKRVNQVLRTCMFLAVGIGIGVSAIVITFGRQLLGLYTADPAVIDYGMVRLWSVIAPYFLFGTMEVACGAMRGIGYAITPTLVSLAGVCTTRITWVYTVFAAYHNLSVLLLAFPVSWAVTTAIHLISFMVVKRKWQIAEI